ncbi:PAS domain S-box protein [Methanothermobacter sp. KEPCO-1]|uniref:sensor histidine kinase n=1 Tax=Methanothermobacter sp. KEPCO-1 TaxID=2603820 RepID=UPI0011CB112F|nr:PAS domain S-box protein [Methanothermobacter sp. KEPCO-1]QEF95176.1 PAS domain S-box protein [Methanothermobacter sp. KEPCO-1]
MDRNLKIFLIAVITLSFISQFLSFKNDLVSLINIITNLAAFLGLLYASIYAKKVYPHLYLTLILLSAGQFFSFLGDLTWFILESILLQSPFPSVADVFYLLYYPLFAAGIFTVPVRRYSDVKSLIDLLIILVASASAAWVFLVKPTVLAGGNPTYVLVAVLYIVGDLLILFMIMDLIINKMGNFRSRTIYIFLASIALLLTADISFTYQTITGIYAKGTFQDLFWAFSYIILLVAVNEFFNEDWNMPTYLTRKSSVVTYIPYAFLVLFYILTAYSLIETDAKNSPELLLSLGIIIVLFVVRQHLSMRENTILLNEVDNERERAENYLEVAGSLIMVLDENSRVKLINSRGLEILECKRGDVEGKNWFMVFVPPEDRNWREGLYKKKISSGEDGYYLTGNIITCRGNRKTVAWHVRFLRENGEFMGSIISGEDITEVERTRKALEMSEKRYREIFELAPSPIISLEDDLTIRDCNNRTESVLGYRKDDLEGRDLRELIHPEDSGEDVEGIRRLIKADGDVIYGNLKLTHAGDELILIVEDQTDTIRSLREKELLLREIHHRVKNNLQIISSLLSIQERKLESEELSRLLRESRDRIRSIALVHEHLYRSTDLTTIRISDYLLNLISKISQGQVEKGSLRIRTDIDDIEFNLETSLPIGLIVNELVSNSLKHSGAENITVALKGVDGMFELVVSDDGVGVESPDALEKAGSMGWHLVNALANQLDAEMKVEAKKGLTVTLRFRELGYIKRY